jgi:hypothetical protein
MTFKSGVTVDMRRGTCQGAVDLCLHLAPPRSSGKRSAPDLCRVYPRSGGRRQRLHVVETGFAQLPVESRRKTCDSHSEGWASELSELADYLDAV